MADAIWIGGAPAEAMVDTLTLPADVEAGQIVTLTIGTKSLPITLAGATLDAITTEILAAWNQSLTPEFAEISATGETNDAEEYTGVIYFTADDPGKPFTMVSVIGSGNNEKQVVSLGGTAATGGTFTLSFGGETTAGIAYNASAATIEAALILLNTIPSGSVSCGGGALPGTPVTVTFQDELAASNVALLVADSSGLTGVTGSAAETTAGGSTIKDKAEYYWDFETVATGGVFDDKVSSQDLTRNSGGVTHGASGRIGNANHYPGGFPGVGTAYLRGQSGAHTKAGTENFSVSAWVKYDSALAGSARMILSNSSSSITNYHLKLNAAGTFTFAMTGTTYSVTSVATATINTWHHVCGVYDTAANLIKISVDGGAFVTAAASYAGSAPASTTLRVGGGYSYGLTSYEDWEGYIDSVGLFDDALTISEVGDLYNSGAGDDYPFPAAGSNEVQTLTLTGTPTAGNVTVSYQGIGVDIPYNSSAAAAEILLDTVSTLGVGNVNVTGGPWPGTALVVEFINDLAVTDVELLDVDTSALVMLVSETTAGVTAPTGSVATTVTPITKTTTTPNSGPNCWDVAANWHLNAVPETGDTVYIGDTDVSILYGLAQSAVTLAEMIVDNTFTGFIGLRRINKDGDTYYEYRETYLEIGATSLRIGDKDGDGSERIKINLGTVQSTVIITNSGTGEDANVPAILLLGTHASNVVTINRGSLGVAYYPTESATVATFQQAFFDDQQGDTDVFIGSGVTLGAVQKSGGDLELHSSTTTLSQTGGVTNIFGGAHPDIDIIDGDLNYNSIGTAVISIGGSGTLNFNQDRRAKTITTITKQSEDCEIYDNSDSVSALVIVMQNLSDYSKIHPGANKTITFS